MTSLFVFCVVSLLSLTQRFFSLSSFVFFAHGRRRGWRWEKRCRCHRSGIACCRATNSRSTAPSSQGWGDGGYSSDSHLQARCTSIAGSCTCTCERLERKGPFSLSLVPFPCPSSLFPCPCSPILLATEGSEPMAAPAPCGVVWTNRTTTAQFRPWTPLIGRPRPGCKRGGGVPMRSSVEDPERS